MLLAADYPLLNIIWTMLVFFGLVIWLRLLFTVFGDLFSRHDISGWGKARMVCLRDRVAVRRRASSISARRESRWRSAARSGRRQLETRRRTITSAKRRVRAARRPRLRRPSSCFDSGAITKDEFDAIKAKAVR